MHKFCKWLILVLALSAAPVFGQVSGLPGAPYAGLSWYLISFELGPWEEYLIAELTPEMEVLEAAPRPHIPWVDALDEALLPEFAPLLLGRDSRRARFILRRQWQRPTYLNHGNGPSVGFQRRLLTPGITREFENNGWWAVSAVLATQQFSYSTLDMKVNEDPHRVGTYPDRWRQPYTEVSHGTGLRVALNREMLPGLSLDAAIQSRIKMDEFAQYRGVYAQAAEFDIPSRMQMGLELKASKNSALTMGVSQIFYSEVNAFPSFALPARFFAVLGDATSPEFAWKDLTVYSVGWRWQRDDLAFHFEYATRSRPEPTSRALADVLDDVLAQDAWLAGVSKQVGHWGELQLNAAYAPPEYAFGGNVLGGVSDRLDQELEVHARWRWTF